MKGTLDVHRQLLAAGVPHEIVRLPVGVQTADCFPSLLSLPPAVCVSVRMYDADGVLHALAVPALSLTRMTTLARALGAKQVEPAAVERVNRVTDFSASLVSPVGLPAEVVLVVDASLGLSDVVYAATGDPGTVLKIRSRDLLIHTNAKVATLTSPVGVPDGAYRRDEIVLPSAPAGTRRSTDRITLPAG